MGIWRTNSNRHWITLGHWRLRLLATRMRQNKTRVVSKLKFKDKFSYSFKG